MSLVPMTKLEAVNEMLSVIGESPINSLSGSLTQDASMAENLLDRTSREVQMHRWVFNVEDNYPLAVDGDGFIQLPTDCLFCDVDPCRQSASMDVVVRGTRLYDRKNQTYVFTTSPIYVELTRFLDFEDLPEAARNYITLRAARKFQDRVQGSQADHFYTAQDEQDARAAMRQHELRSGDQTIFSNYNVARTLRRTPRW